MTTSTVTNYAKEIIAIAIGSDLSDKIIRSIGIGNGSGTVTSSQTTLFGETARGMQTGSPDVSTSRKITFQGDFNSTQMSGLTLSEFGWFQSGATAIGSAWFVTNFGSLTFDGTNEIQITTTFEVI